MKVSYDVREGYLHVKATGEFVLSAAQDIFFEWVKKTRGHALNQILCDITLLTGFDALQMSTMTRFKTSQFIAGSLPMGFRLAVLETPQQLERDRFGENVMVNKGAIVKATTNLNEALEWLRATSANDSAKADIQQIAPQGRFCKMKVSYEVRKDYLCVKATGEFVLSAVQDIFFEWIQEARCHGVNRALYDITLLTGFDAQQVPTMDKFALSEFIAKSLPKGFRLAVLETPQQLEKDRFSENVMVNRGAIVKVTTNLNEALEWLDVTSSDNPVGRGDNVKAKEYNCL